MAESYWAVMGQRLLFWSGWFFTVFGVIVGLILSKEYSWISVLILIALAITFGTHSWWVHQRIADAQKAHEIELEIVRKKHHDEIYRREQAEKRLAEVPASALDRLAGLVSEGAIKELISLLTQQADLVGRLQKFKATQTKPLSIRSFERIRSELYVVVRGIEGAIALLKIGDPFILLRSNESGVEVEAAKLSVHQPVEPDSDTVFMRVIAAVGDDITYLSGLAGDRPVAGLKGYRVVPALEISMLPGIDFSNIAEAIPHLLTGMLKARSS